MAVEMSSCFTVGRNVSSEPFTHADGCTYKAFLINAESSVPLCAAADLPTVCPPPLCGNHEKQNERDANGVPLILCPGKTAY